MFFYVFRVGVVFYIYFKLFIGRGNGVIMVGFGWKRDILGLVWVFFEGCSCFGEGEWNLDMLVRKTEGGMVI